jgi:hypothetical protein
MEHSGDLDLKAGLPLAQLAEGAIVSGRVDGEEAILIRRGNDYFAVGATCTHYHGALEKLPARPPPIFSICAPWRIAVQSLRPPYWPKWSHGVTFHLGRSLRLIDGRQVILDDGTILQADFVVLGVIPIPGTRSASSIGWLRSARVRRRHATCWAFASHSRPRHFSGANIMTLRSITSDMRRSTLNSLGFRLGTAFRLAG